VDLQLVWARVTGWVKLGGWRPVLGVLASVLLIASLGGELAESRDSWERWIWAALLAAVFGAPLFLWLAVARSRIARPVGIGLAGLMVVVYGLSRWQPGNVAPPQWDWLFVFASLAFPACAFALWVVRRMARREGLRRLPTGYTVAGLTLAMAALFSSCVAVGITTGKFKSGLTTLSVNPRPGEVLPLPEGLTLVGTDDGCGSSGYCSPIFAVTGPMDWTSDQLAARLAEHLVKTGWRPNRADVHGASTFAKPVGGLLNWHGHMAWVSTNPDDARGFWPTVIPPGAVFLWVASWSPLTGGFRDTTPGLVRWHTVGRAPISASGARP
jgi:hypothetical protein